MTSQKLQDLKVIVELFWVMADKAIALFVLGDWNVT